MPKIFIASEQTMRWGNLKKNLCPECNKDLMDGLEVEVKENGQKLMKHPCGFKIYEKRFSEIVNSQVTANLALILEEEYKDYDRQ